MRRLELRKEDLADNRQFHLILDLDRACIRYLEIRIEYYKTQQSELDISEIDTTRTRAHNALIACFNPVLRMSQDPEMAKSSVNRIEIGKWGMKRALTLLDGSKSAGNL